MTNQIQFTIEPEHLATLGKLSGHELSPVSPFRYGKETDAAGSIARLAALGICDAKGKIYDDKADAIDALALAGGFTRVYLTTPSRVVEYVAYFAPGNKIAGVTNDGGKLQVVFPAPTDDFLDLVFHTVGFSRYRSIPFAAQLNGAEALVFSAMLDLQRKEMLRKFSEGKSAERVTMSDKDVRKMLTTPQGPVPWISGTFLELLPPERIPKPREMASVFASLATKGLVTSTGDGHTLSDTGVLLARSHLMPSMYFTLTIGKSEPSGTTRVSGFSCIISGIHDLLSIDNKAGIFELESVSSMKVYEYAKTFLTDRSVLAAMDTKPPAAPAEEKERRCPECGASLKSGVRFCGACGIQVP